MKNLDNVVFVISGVRSGTTVFRKMLDSSANIRDSGEVFNSNNSRGWYDYLISRCQTDPASLYPERQQQIFIDYLFSHASSSPHVQLFDVKYEHLGLLSDAWKLPFCSPLIVSLINELNARVIHLRRNPVDSVISNMVAVSRNIYHFEAHETEVEADLPLVTINPRGFDWSVRERIKTADYISSAITHDHLLELDYEDIFVSSDTEGQVFSSEVCQQIADFLAITNDLNATPSLKKVINEPITSIIANFDDIAATCAKYNHYFKRNERL